MAQISRFQFPGFQMLRHQDTLTHQVEVGVIEDGGTVFTLHMLRNTELAEHFPDVNFLVSTVLNADGCSLWNFKQEFFVGMGILAMADEHVVIALIGKGKNGKVERVVLLENLLSKKPLDLRVQVSAKIAAAKYLNREYLLSTVEKALMRVDHELKVAAEEEARNLAKEARSLARTERMKRILSRGKISGFTVDGRQRSGYAVLEEEWSSLSDGANVITVDSVDDEAGVIGNLLEAFRVVKERGKSPTKRYPCRVFASAPKDAAGESKADVPPESTGSAIIESDDGVVVEVRLYASIEDIRLARIAGLNGGTLVAVDNPGEDGRIEVYVAHRAKMDTLGLFKPIVSGV